MPRKMGMLPNVSRLAVHLALDPPAQSPKPLARALSHGTEDRVEEMTQEGDAAAGCGVVGPCVSSLESASLLASGHFRGLSCGYSQHRGRFLLGGHLPETQPHALHTAGT